MTTSTVTARDVLVRAQQVLNDVGWAKGGLSPNGCLCTLEAINAACVQLYDGAISMTVLRRSHELMREQAGRFSLAIWNDKAERTKDEVLAAFQRAANDPRAVTSEPILKTWQTW